MPRKKDPLLRARIIALLEEPHMRSPVVILNEPQSNLILPIWIGEPEARSIAIALEGINISRPLTHSLLKNIISELGGKIVKIAIDSLAAGTYHATIYVKVGRKTIKIDARPSDSIALALAAEVPVFVAQSILEVAGQENPFPADLVAAAESKVEKKDMPQAQAEFSKEEVKTLKAMLKKARAKEQSENKREN